MKQLATVVTRKGQITIPVEIRRSLGLRRGDKVVFLFDKRQVRLRKGESVVDRTAGMMKGKHPRLSARQLRRAGELAIAEAMIERSRG